MAVGAAILLYSAVIRRYQGLNTPEDLWKRRGWDTVCRKIFKGCSLVECYERFGRNWCLHLCCSRLIGTWSRGQQVGSTKMSTYFYHSTLRHTPGDIISNNIHSVISITCQTPYPTPDRQRPLRPGTSSPLHSQAVPGRTQDATAIINVIFTHHWSKLWTYCLSEIRWIAVNNTLLPLDSELYSILLFEETC
jgi:hypothetical protein